MPGKHRGYCPTCLDKGTFRWYVPDAEGGTRNPDSIGTYECPCADQYLLWRRFLHAGITETYQKLAWDDYYALSDQVAEPLLDYLENADGFIQAGLALTIWGTSKGTGKTLAATLVAKNLVVRGYDVYVQKFSDMLDAFAAGWKDREDKVWFNERIRNAAILVIDDLGREQYKGVETLGSHTLESVLRHRVTRDMPTLITTNFTPEQMTGGYGGHTVSLLSEKAIPVEVIGHDHRTEVNLRSVNEKRNGLTRPVVVG